jgi:hypothetical protein
LPAGREFLPLGAKVSVALPIDLPPVTESSGRLVLRRVLLLSDAHRAGGNQALRSDIAGDVTSMNDAQFTASG